MMLLVEMLGKPPSAATGWLEGLLELADVHGDALGVDELVQLRHADLRTRVTPASRGELEEFISILLP
jgi:hypothetical protein